MNIEELEQKHNALDARVQRIESYLRGMSERWKLLQAIMEQLKKDARRVCKCGHTKHTHPFGECLVCDCKRFRPKRKTC
jgi:hypothetical protein